MASQFLAKVICNIFTGNGIRIFEAVSDVSCDGGRLGGPGDGRLRRNDRVRIRQRHQENDLFRIEAVEGIVEELVEEDVFIGRWHVGQADVLIVDVGPVS